jgi:pyrroloquinoline quinone (PQQ) biosynthesis protein C
MSTDLSQRVNDTLRERQLLAHPFYRRWEAGGLTPDELTAYAEQYRFFEALMPSFLRALADQLDGAPRELVLANLRDEVTPPSHLELFDRFANFYGAQEVTVSPAMVRLVEAYGTVLERGPVCALAGLLAYESQGAAVADSKGAGLTSHYGASEDATAFWREHGTLEGDHASWTLEALASLEPDLDEVAEGAWLVGDAWWTFLDERELLRAELVSR